MRKYSLLKAANNRSTKGSRLTGFIANRIKDTSKGDIDNIIEDLFIKKIVYEENGIIKYSLDKLYRFA
jgi:hypothetical protein